MRLPRRYLGLFFAAALLPACAGGFAEDSAGAGGGDNNGFDNGGNNGGGNGLPPGCGQEPCDDPGPVSSPTLLDLHLLPPNNETAGLVEQQLRGVEVDEIGSLESTLVASVPLRASFSVGGTPLSDPIRVTAVASDTIPGTALTFEGRRLEASGEPIELSVVPGRYRIIARPTEALRGGVSLPPLVMRDVDVGREGAELSMSWPAVDALWEVLGRVVQGDPPEPVPGMNVRGVSTDGSVTTSGVTDADGIFQIYALPDPEDAPPRSYTIEIRAPVEGPPLPDVDIPGLLMDPSQPQLGDLSLGVLGEPVSFAGLLLGGDDPIPNAVVQIEGQSGAGTLSAQTITDELGSFEVKLRTGHYTLTLAPADGDTYGLTVVSGIEVQGSIEPEVIMAEPKTMLSGFVFAPDGSPVIEAVVNVQRSADSLGGAAILAREARTLTDESGAWSMRVDRGTYTLTVDPPVGAGLPRTFSRDLVVGAHETQLDIAVQPGRRVEAVVRTPTSSEGGSQVLPGVQALVYRRLTPDAMGEEPDAALLGQAVSDESGRFTVIVPAPAGAP